jgi:hypothetical protein
MYRRIINNYIAVPSSSPPPVTYPWYACEGLGDELCVAAYKPLGAASIADSYINLANPGTYNCTNPGESPNWNTGNGWICNGDSYIVTGADLDHAIMPTFGMSILIRYSNWSPVNGEEWLFGATDQVPSDFGVHYVSKPYMGYKAMSASSFDWVPIRSLDIVVLTPTKRYVNGSLLDYGTYHGIAGYNEDGPLCIGTHGIYSGGVRTTLYPANVNVQAFAIYKADISAFASTLAAQAQALT